MTAVTSPIVWYTTRASGTVALVLLTASMILGIMTAVRAGGAVLPRFAVSDLHRRVSLLSMCFLAVHVVTAALDSFVPIGLVATVVPFTSGYRPLWVGLGAVAFDLLLAVVVSSLLRLRISAPSWRAIHWLVYASWPVAVLHAVFTGTDLRFGWMDVLVGGCVASVLAALAWRVVAHPRPGGALTALPPRGASRVPVGDRRS